MGMRMTRRLRALRLGSTLGLLAALLVGSASAQTGQEVVLAVGNSAIIPAGGTLTRIAVGDPNVATATTAGATDVLVNGVAPGSTSLFIWTQNGTRNSYTIRVTLDAPSLEREIGALFPTENIRVTAVGRSIILSGRLQDPRVEDKVVQLASSIGENVTVMNNLAIPNPGQVLLQVRFAEVSRSWQRELGPNVVTYSGNNVDAALGPVENTRSSNRDDAIAEVFSDAVNLFLFHKPSNVAAFIQALERNGLFKSLAEPNLIAMPAETASFLAGGEFPFPILQGSQNNNTVTIQFKEFGIRLNFIPNITNSGSVRLKVSPEVSALDFANGLVLQGFTIPSLLTRRASTVVELGGRPDLRDRRPGGQLDRREHQQGAVHRRHPDPRRAVQVERAPAEPVGAAGPGDSANRPAARPGAAAADGRARDVGLERVHSRSGRQRDDVGRDDRRPDDGKHHIG